MLTALTKVRKAHWEGNKRTFKTEHRVPDEILKKVRSCRDDGQFEEVVRLLEDEDLQQVLSGDHIALQNLALARFGLRDHAGAHEELDRAERALNLAFAAILINRANVYKIEGNYDAALEAALKAREFAPESSIPLLSLIAILEARGSPSDAEAVEQAAENLRKSWGSFEERGENPRLYLDSDMDYHDLREDSDRFQRLFGYFPPQNTLSSNDPTQG